MSFSGLIIGCMASLVFSWWTYCKYTSFSPTTRYALIGLRTLTLCLLLYLLFNSVFESYVSMEQKTELTILADESVSTAIEKGRYKGIESYKNVLSQIAAIDTSKVTIHWFGFGATTSATRPDSIRFDRQSTDLNQALNQVRVQHPGSAGIILISDGISNQGKDPIYGIEATATPLFVVALGDTTSERDLIAEELDLSSQSFVNSKNVATLRIRNRGMGDQSLRVNWFISEQAVGSQIVSIKGGNSLTAIERELSFDAPGLFLLRAAFEPIDGEFSQENNESVASIKVLENKTRILHLALETHPDVRSIRSILLQDPTINLSTLDFGKNGILGDGVLSQMPDTLDLLIVQGWNPTHVPAFLLSDLEKLISERPSLFILTPSSLWDNPNMPFPITIRNNAQATTFDLSLNTDQQNHPILLNLPTEQPHNLASLSGYVFGNNAKNLSTALAFAQIQGETIKEAQLISLYERGNLRYASLNAFNWYLWNDPDSEINRAFYHSLILSLTQWTATPPNSELLKVVPTKSMFGGNEAVRLSGELYNEVGEKETRASISVTLKGKQNKRYTMAKSKTGGYSLEIENLPPRKYEYEAQAVLGGEQIAMMSGEFLVGRLNAELTNTVRNERSLRQLAEFTQGFYIDFEQINVLKDSLSQRGFFQPLVQQRKHSAHLIDYPLWFILVLVSLGLEWLLRKKVALP